MRRESAALHLRQDFGHTFFARFIHRTAPLLDRPAFNRTRLKAENSIGSKVLEQPASKWTQVALGVILLSERWMP